MLENPWNGHSSGYFFKNTDSISIIHFLSMVPKKEKIKQLIITVLSDLFRKKITSFIKKNPTSLESAGNELRPSIQLKSKSRKKWNIRTKESFPNPQESEFSLFLRETLPDPNQMLWLPYISIYIRFPKILKQNIEPVRSYEKKE